MHCIETNQLVHRYARDETVLNGINLQVPTGSIYGFLGPNGAGKTTTIRLILGLLRRQAGTISIFGQHLETHRIEILRRVGAMIESPSLYDHLSATENLALLRTVYQCPPCQISQVLGLVGLSHTGTKRTGRFSLGMKQRLGIAIALLHRPDLLILDEPTNGLDPNGIIEIRELLQSLNREHGLTILISSHQLSEIEKLVSHLGVIARGQLVFQGQLEELRRRQDRVRDVSIRVSEPARALAVVAAAGLTGRVDGEHVVLPSLPAATVATINQRLVTAGMAVSEIAFAKDDLESIFLQLIAPPAHD